MDAGTQVGIVVFGSVDRAALWSGSSGSFVDLTPAAAGASRAYGISGPTIVGEAEFSPFLPQAGLWSEGVFVSLHPVGWAMSSARGVAPGVQVGFVGTGTFGQERAALWNGSAASFVDLHGFLGPEFTVSEARAVWTQGGVTHVAGVGRTAGGRRAVVWTHTP